MKCINQIFPFVVPILFCGAFASLQGDELPILKDNEITEIIVPEKKRNEELQIEGLLNPLTGIVFYSEGFKKKFIENGSHEAIGCTIREVRSPPPVSSMVGIFHSTLKVGDVVPMAGAICRFTGLKPARSGNRWEAHFDVLRTDELPEGVQHPRRMHAIPLGGKMGGGGGGKLTIQDIVADKENVQSLVVVAQQPIVNWNEKEERYLEAGVADMRLHLDDQFVLGGTYQAGGRAKYAVRGIVPPNPKQQIIGWVLVEPLAEEK